MIDKKWTVLYPIIYVCVYIYIYIYILIYDIIKRSKLQDSIISLLEIKRYITFMHLYTEKIKS